MFPDKSIKTFAVPFRFRKRAGRMIYGRPCDGRHVMPYFRCKLHGQNFAHAHKDHAAAVNFYAVRWVEAFTDELAAREALDRVTRQIEDNGIEPAKDPHGTLEVEDVEEVDGDGYKPSHDAFVFY